MLSEQKTRSSTSFRPTRESQGIAPAPAPARASNTTFRPAQELSKTSSGPSVATIPSLTTFTRQSRFTDSLVLMPRFHETKSTLTLPARKMPRKDTAAGFNQLSLPQSQSSLIVFWWQSLTTEDLNLGVHYVFAVDVKRGQEKKRDNGFNVSIRFILTRHKNIAGCAYDIQCPIFDFSLFLTERCVGETGAESRRVRQGKIPLDYAVTLPGTTRQNQ